jgi:hypothetical protein
VDGSLTPAQEQQIPATGINYTNELSLSSGKYLVRFVVRDNIGRIGSVQAPLEVK